MKTFVSGILSGLLVSIGGTVFLACDDRYMGAILFSVALLCICYKGYYLYTGKIGLVLEKGDKDKFKKLALGLLGNTVGAVLTGLVIAVTKTPLMETATGLVEKKLSMGMGSVFAASALCGVLMYLAVTIFRDKKSPLAIIFCIPVFILSGFEHSIADMFYFAAGLSFDACSILFILNVVLGNSVGAILIALLTNYSSSD